MPLPKTAFKRPVMVFWWREELKAVPVQQRLLREESQKETERAVLKVSRVTGPEVDSEA